ncbi:hypothetical protein Ddye_021295 [Dipteronia dyeriana]|uniref:Defensin-like protein n=1 Tax=Dipteronia dyeriana TaxID=168575 RepID=A0AAD9U1C0_9ROSI|nr:hypothetical protein Ddye_021295 [Dipteronia dyeriana]
MVKGDLCWDDLGRCNATCDQKCTSTHPGGKGSCDVSGGAAPSCKCFYDCTLPAPKTCTSGIGRCSVTCDDTCCSKNCAAKFPGREATGICNNVVGPGPGYCLTGQGLHNQASLSMSIWFLMVNVLDSRDYLSLRSFEVILRVSLLRLDLKR